MFTCNQTSRSSVGFGFDSSVNHYKIITISTYFDNGGGYWFHIYSLATNTWRQLDPFKISVECPSIIHVWGDDDKRVSFTGIRGAVNGFYFNGACHWYNNEMKDKRILSFNLKDEKFRVYGIPKVLICNEQPCSVTEVDGCLAVVCSIKNSNQSSQTSFARFEVWMMRFYGVDSSWSKVYSIPTQGKNHIFVGNDDEEFFVKEGNNQLVSYNLHANDIKRKNYENCAPPCSFLISPYRETLVPVKPPTI